MLGAQWESNVQAHQLTSGCVSVHRRNGRPQSSVVPTMCGSYRSPSALAYPHSVTKTGTSRAGSPKFASQVSRSQEGNRWTVYSRSSPSKGASGAKRVIDVHCGDPTRTGVSGARSRIRSTHGWAVSRQARQLSIPFPAGSVGSLNSS